MQGPLPHTLGASVSGFPLQRSWLCHQEGAATPEAASAGLPCCGAEVECEKGSPRGQGPGS